jgi:hypothetical protein
MDVNQDDSINTVFDYGLDYWDSIPPVACVQISSVAHPDSCPMGTGDPFPRE